MPPAGPRRGPSLQARLRVTVAALRPRFRVPPEPWSDRRQSDRLRDSRVRQMSDRCPTVRQRPTVRQSDSSDSCPTVTMCSCCHTPLRHLRQGSDNSDSSPTAPTDGKSFLPRIQSFFFKQHSLLIQVHHTALNSIKCIVAHCIRLHSILSMSNGSGMDVPRDVPITPRPVPTLEKNAQNTPISKPVSSMRVSSQPGLQNCNAGMRTPLFIDLWQQIAGS